MKVSHNDNNVPYVLEQHVRETKYGRKFINQRIVDEVNNAVCGEMSKMFKEACDSITAYLDGDNYYNRKQIEVDHVRRNMYHKKYTVQDMVVTILVSVMPRVGAQSIQGVCSTLSNFLGFEDIFAGTRVASSMITAMSYAEFYRIIPASDSESGSVMLVSNYMLSEETRQFIANTQYMPPMIVPPLKVSNNYDRVHYSYEESMILGSDNHHNLTLNYQNINWANNTPLALDERMCAMEEQPKNAAAVDTEEKLHNFERMKASSKLIEEDLIAAGNKFYVPIKNCKRGREHTQGYHVNIQGSSSKKARVNLWKKEIVTL